MPPIALALTNVTWATQGITPPPASITVLLKYDTNSGKGADDIFLRMPVGTVIYNLNTDEILADATALEAVLMRALPEELSFRVEDAIWEGDGVAKPKGFIGGYTKVANASWVDGQIGYLATGVAGDFAATAPGDRLIDLCHIVAVVPVADGPAGQQRDADNRDRGQQPELQALASLLTRQCQASELLLGEHQLAQQTGQEIAATTARP